MTDATRARIVRGWLLCAAATLLFLAGAPAWLCLAPVALVMPPLFACEAACNRCLNDYGPCEFEVVITGVANGSCANCTQANDTFLMTYLSFYLDPTGSKTAQNNTLSCRWLNIDITGFCGALSGIVLHIQYSLTSRVIQVFLREVGFLSTSFRLIEAPGTAGTSCHTIDHDLPPFGQEDCDLSSATCHVTAL